MRLKNNKNQLLKDWLLHWAFISANFAVKSTLFSFITGLKLGLGTLEDTEMGGPMIGCLTGDSRFPRRFENEKSLTSLFNQFSSLWFINSWEGGDGGDDWTAEERLGKLSIFICSFWALIVLFSWGLGGVWSKELSKEGSWQFAAAARRPKTKNRN